MCVDTVRLVRLCIVEQLCNSVESVSLKLPVTATNVILCTKSLHSQFGSRGKGVRTQPLFLIHMIRTKIRDMWPQPALSCTPNDYSARNRVIPVRGVLYHHKCSGAYGRNDRLM